MLDVAIAMEEVFVRGKDGRYWSPSGFSSEFWSRYGNVFERVSVVARVIDGEPPSGASQVPEQVAVIPLPAYRGFFSSVFFFPLLMFRFFFISGNKLYFLRAPGVISMALGLVLSMRRVAYAVELVGDIDDVLGVLLKNRIYSFIRIPVLFLSRLVVRQAKGVAYVTNSSLQLKYPCGSRAVSASYSSVMIDYVAAARAMPSAREPIRIISVGTFSKSYKGFDTVIRAVRSLIDSGVEVEAVIVGDGDLLGEYVSLSDSLGLSSFIRFTGRVSREEVLKYMDAADVYVSASRTEGLPRVIIEAMSRALPVISTPVGGCAEVVLPEYLFPVDDIGSLVGRVVALFGSEAEWLRSMNHSRSIAHGYLREKVEKNRRDFMESL